MKSNLDTLASDGEERAPAHRGKLESIVDLSPLVIYTCEPGGDFRATYMSNGVKRFWGYEPEEFLTGGPFWLDRLHPEDKPRIVNELPRVFELDHHSIDYRFRTKRGDYCWTRSHVRLIRDARGKPLEIVGYCFDITAEKDSEKSLRQSQEQLSLVFNSTSDWQMLLRVEPDGRFVTEAINHAFLKVLKPLAGSADLNERDVENIFALLDCSAEQIGFRLSVFRQVVAEKKSTHYDAPESRMGMSLDVTISPVLDGHGRCTHLVWTGRDITERNAVVETLRRETRDLNEAQRIAKVGSWYRTSKMEKAAWSEELYRIYALDPNLHPPSIEEMSEFFTPEGWERRCLAMDRLLRDGQSREFAEEIVRADGEKRWIIARIEAERDPEGSVMGLRGTVQDITDQRQMEVALRTRETQLGLIFNSTTDAKALLRITDQGQYRFETVNRAYGELVETAFRASKLGIEGRERAEVLAEFGFPEEVIRHELPMYDQAVRDGHAVHKEVAFPAADGSSLFMEVRVQPIHDGDGRCTHVLWSGRDITERMKAENQLRASLREKETLLREVHHRVKNNLQIISSLLHFHAKSTTDVGAAAVFREGQDRLRSMLLVHDKLYRSANLAAIDFADYVNTLTTELARSHQLLALGIQLRVQADKIFLPAEIVLPCGMIINELVTNAFKHGFPAGRTGQIVVRIERFETSMEISVEDDGVGVRERHEGPAGFGADLIQNLAEQLGGTVAHRIEPGTKVTIHIPYDNVHHSA